MSPRLKIQDKNDNLRKRVHRQAAVELGVPPYIAFRAKNPAQSGSGIHKIVENIAKKQIHGIDPELVDENIKRDKGSIYRYGEDMYGDETARFYLQRIEENIQKKYIPQFLSA
jgi:asparagine synthase (glutamine-hydrolysing)